MEARLREPVEGLFQVGEFEVEAGGVLLGGPVGVTALVEGLSEDLLGQGDPTAHHDAGDAAELGVRLVVPHRGVGAAVAHGEEARALVQRRPLKPVAAALRVAILQVALAALVVEGALLGDLGRQQLHQVAQLEVLGLPQEPLLLGEVLGQRQLLVPQVIQHVPEEEAVAVDEEARPAVPGQLAGRRRAAPARGEHGGQRAVRDAEQRGVPRHVHLAPHVQLHHLGERRARRPRHHVADGQDAAARLLQSHGCERAAAKEGLPPKKAGLPPPLLPSPPLHPHLPSSSS